jgi:uncharacterized protein YueI
MLEEQDRTLLVAAELKLVTYIYIFVYIKLCSKYQNKWNIVAHKQLQYADRFKSRWHVTTAVKEFGAFSELF